MARSEPGSLAARSHLKNKLTFFRRKSRRKSNRGTGSVGEVTIEIEDDPKLGLPTPSKASPSVDCESGPSSTSPTLTMSPMSTPITHGSTASHSPYTQQGDASSRHSPQSQTKTDEANSTMSIKTEDTKPDPTPNFDPEHANQRSLVAIATTSDPGTISSPTPEVVLRKPRSSPQSSDSLKFQREKFKRYSISRFQARNSNNEAGKLLKLALDRHFDEKLDVAAQFAPDLDNYVSEVFLQLDYHHCGTISKEDFETLCEVLQITISPPASYRNSGIEWLSSYRPRANSPMSPIRVDKLNEVKYRHPNGKKSNFAIDPPPNFLFTIGPRPFWELWPQKKRKKKRFTIDEFKKCLLEQWAKNMGYPLSKVSTALPVTVSPSHSVQEKPPTSSSSPDAIETIAIEERNGHHLNGGSQVHHHMTLNETRTRRLMRSVVRVTKRYQMLDKISKRLQRQLSDENVTTDGKAPMVNGMNGVSQNNNIQPKPCPVHQTSLPSSPTAFDRSRTNGTRHNTNRQGSTLAPSSMSHGTSCSSHCHSNGVALQRVKSRQSWRSSRSGGARVVSLEKQVLHQQEEIRTLRDVIEDLRSSLQLSDAQNLALQVLLRKMAKAEIQLPLASDDTFRSQMNENEKQLENLVKELKEMSQIRYPRLSTSNKISPVAHTGTGTSSSDSFNPESILLEDELDQTSQALGGAQNELKAAQQELRHTAIKLQEKESELKENSVDLNDAYKALEKAQQELNKMRLELEEAQVQVEVTKHEMCETQEELLLTRCQVRNSDAQLRDTEKRLSQLNQNRRSLILELQATRELLVSSLNKVQDLELENRKVPLLEKKVTLLEKTRKSESSTSNQLKSILTHLRPLSTMDSGLYSTSDSDEQCSPRAHDKSVDACSDEELQVPAHSPTSDQGRPPRPPSSAKLGTKTSRSNTPLSDKSSGKRPQTPCSSGHYSAGSSSSKKSPSQSTTHSPGSSAGLNTSGSSSGSTANETISKLRAEIEALKRKFVDSEKNWQEERNVLLEEIIRRHDEKNDISTDVQVLEAQRVRLTLLEEKIKEVLNMLRTLNSMNISSKTLGMLVLDSVERSIDPLSGEIQVFKFLNHLYNSARDYERLSTESQIHNALRAVEAHTQTLADIEAAQQTSQRRLALDVNHYQVPRRIGRGDPFATIDV